MKWTIIVLAIALTSGCATKPDSGKFIPHSTREQNKALSKHLNSTWLIYIAQLTPEGMKNIAELSEADEVAEFTKSMRISNPAMPCMCAGDILITAHRTDGSMIEFWYEPQKLSGSKGSKVYGTPSDEFNSIMKQIIANQQVEPTVKTSGDQDNEQGTDTAHP